MESSSRVESSVVRLFFLIDLGGRGAGCWIFLLSFSFFVSVIPSIPSRHRRMSTCSLGEVICSYGTYCALQHVNLLSGWRWMVGAPSSFNRVLILTINSLVDSPLTWLVAQIQSKRFTNCRGMYPNAAGKIASNGPYGSVKDIYKIPNLTENDKKVFKMYEKDLTANKAQVRWFVAMTRTVLCSLLICCLARWRWMVGAPSSFNRFSYSQ